MGIARSVEGHFAAWGIQCRIAALRRVLLVALCAASSMWIAAPASAGDRGVAESLFEAGKALLEQGRVDEACPKFAESMRVEPAVGALLNLARCHELQGKTATAWAEYRHAAVMARVEGQPDRAEGAADYASRLEPKLSRLTISVPEPVAGLRVDRNGVQVGSAVLGVPTFVDPGSQRIEAAAPSHRAWSTTITVSPDGDQQVVVVPLLAAASPLPAEGAAPTADEQGSTVYYTVAIVASGVALAGVAVGTGFGVSANSKWNDAQEACPEAPEYCGADGVELAEEANDAANLSTVGFAFGGAGAAAAVVFWILAVNADEESEANPADSALRFGPIVAPGAAGASLTGVF